MLLNHNVYIKLHAPMLNTPKILICNSGKFVIQGNLLRLIKPALCPSNCHLNYGILITCKFDVLSNVCIPLNLESMYVKLHVYFNIKMYVKLLAKLNAKFHAESSERVHAKLT